MDYRDQFIKHTAQTLGLPEDLVHKVVSFQWRSVKEATATGSTIEISGLGRFMVRMNRVEENKALFARYLAAAETELEALAPEDERWYAVYRKIKSIKADQAFLNTKHPDPSLLAFRAKKTKNPDEAGTQENTGRPD